MEKKFNYNVPIVYLNYDTIYKASGDINNVLMRRACFADVLNRGVIQKEVYEIFLIRDDSHLKKRYNNCCFFTFDEVVRHVRLAQRLFHFSYKVEESNLEKTPCFKVTLNLDGPHIYHRYLLTWVRYLYEAPFNLILKDSLQLKDRYLKRVSFTNLFILCAACYQGGPYYNSGHAISYISSRFMKEGELKSRLRVVPCLNNIYKINGSYLECIKPETILTNWLNDNTLKERIKVYIAAYKKMKKL